MISNPTKSPRTAALYAETLTMPLEYQLARMTMLCEEMEMNTVINAALLKLSHVMDDAAQGITEPQVYAYATTLRVLIGVDGKQAAIDAVIASQKDADRG